MTQIKLSLLALLVGWTAGAQAESTTQQKGVAQEVRAEAELGVILTTGNTETASFKGKVALKHETQNWENEYLFDSLYKEDRLDNDSVKETEVTAKKYFISAQSNYKLNKKKSALFVYGSYTDDRFSGFKYQSSVAFGYSDQLFSTDMSHFKYSVGPGYTFNESNSGVADESSMLRLALAYENTLSDSAKFNQSLSSEVVFEEGSNTLSKSETAITSKLMGNLNLKASYLVTHNSEVAADKEKTDTTTSISVVFLF